MQQGEIVDARLSEVSEYHGVKTEKFSLDNLICSDCVPVCEMEHFKGKLIMTPNGETIIDFGQNLAGYVEFTLKAHEGDIIVLTHGETLDTLRFIMESVWIRMAILRRKTFRTENVIKKVAQSSRLCIHVQREKIIIRRSFRYGDSGMQRLRPRLTFQMQYLQQ